jgi:cephalosporin hydroxylase
MGRDRLKWIDSPSDAERSYEDGPGRESWGARFRVGDIEFHCGYEDSESRHFAILKDPALVEEYLEIVRRFQGENLVELGIASGGSVALTALVATPGKLVAIDLDPDRVHPLDELIAERGIGDRVRVYYGIDQADQMRLADIVQDEFGEEPLGLVIDDASHLLPQTRASFETLFPRLRPGGLFVIEDWNHQHLLSRGLSAALATPSPDLEAQFGRRLAEGPPEAPLTQLIVELMLARGESHEFVREVQVDRRWARVYRGSGELDPSKFRLADFITNDFGLLPPGWRTRGAS